MAEEATVRFRKDDGFFIYKAAFIARKMGRRIDTPGREQALLSKVVFDD